MFYRETSPASAGGRQRRTEAWALRALRQLHLWIGLTLCVPLMVLGLSGSILVFHDELAGLLDPRPLLTCATGQAHAIAEIIASARARIGPHFEPYEYDSARAPGLPATVRVLNPDGGNRRGRGVWVILVDPVSLNSVRWNYHPFPGFLDVVLRLHGDLLMGRGGRAYVGWLGVATLGLGVSGLVLWWPRPKRWRAAFLVTRGARGLRLYRELHGAVGIWSLGLLILVSSTGIYFAFPRTVEAGIRVLLPSPRTFSLPPILEDDGAPVIDPDRAVSAALSAFPGTRVLSVGLPVRVGQPYRVSLAEAGDGPSRALTAVINPWSAKVIGLIDPRRFTLGQTVVEWQSMLHFGQGLGWVWRILLCVSGLLPTIFAVTGAAMWLIKRRGARRRAYARTVNFDV